MNVQDALGTAQGDLEKVREIITTTEGTYQFLSETEATLAELLGSGNEEVGKIGQATAKTEELQGALNNAMANLESLVEILGDIL